MRSKIEDPRFYYWCDRLGCLAIQDLPSFESFGPRSMELAETTLREVIDRDFNHPSIIARVLFQEGRGIAMGGYDATRVEWVRSVVKLARELDGTRLVVDNIGRAPDHVDTDVAFWTLDTVDYDRAKEVIERRKDQPVGALFRSGTARETVPRMIGEFRAVQAGGGDRDASAAFFDLLGAVSHAAEFTAGFFYGALTDTEWDHAGLLNFDRTPKDFGRSIEGVAGPFVGVADDLRRLVDSTPGGTSGFTVHFQHLPQEGGTGKITGYSYSLDGIDYRGNIVQSNPVTTTSSRTIGPGVTHRASVDLPDKPFAGMLHFAVTKELPDSSGSISIPVILRHTNPPPRVSVFDDGKILALHFEPREFASIDPPPVADRHSGLMRFKGAGYVEYRLRLPDSIPLEKIAAVGFEAELAAAGDDRLLDWPVVRRRTDQPQTDSVETPSRVVVSVANETAAPLGLKKAPNDIRGVLSRSSGYPHAIYGDVHRVWIDDPKLQRRDIDVRLEVTSGAGLALFGRDMGRSLVAPALLLKLDSALDPVPDFAQTRTIRERLGDRSHVLVSTAEKDEVEWHYTLQRPLENWTSVDFDDGAWLKGPSAFGDSVDANDNVRTAWETPGIWLRRRFDATESDVDGQLYVRLRHQEDVDVFLNGTRILRSLGSRARYETVMLPEDLFVSLDVGENVLAVNCRNGLGTPFLDAGLLVDQ
ncbi:MAG: hypothetical protein MK538_17460, partial [Planctomycetes bacterium]|nr:hypothetical protein [Planctomycetota bacterium]